MKSKQITFGGILSFMSQFISIIVGILYTPILITLLGQQEYGLYQLVSSIIMYLSLMNLGLSGAYIRYYSMIKDKKSKELADLNGMFMNIFIVISLICFIMGFVFYNNISILGNNITPGEYEIAKKLTIWLIASMAISFPNSLTIAYLSANEEFVFIKFVNILNNILIPILTIPVLLIFDFGSVGVVAISCMLSYIRFFLNLYYCKRKLGFKINLLSFKKEVFFDLLNFTFFIFLSDLVDQLNTNVDKLLLGRLIGTSAVAIYSVGFSLKTYFTQLTWIVPELFIPQVNRIIYEENSNEKLTNLFITTGKINNYLVCLIISGFLLFGKDFILLWVGENYIESYYVGLLLMFSGYVPAVQSLGTNIQNAKNMHQVRSIVYFFVAVSNVFLSIFLIKHFGIIGAVYGTLMSVFIGHLGFMNYYYYKKLKLNIILFWKKMFAIIPMLFICCCLGMLMNKLLSSLNWGILVLKICLYTVFYIIFLYFTTLSNEEKNMFKILLQKISKRR